MGFQERRGEFSVLRAVGATRGQVKAIWIVEAGVIGLTGGFSGLILGLGLVMIYTLVVGGGFMGLFDFPVREAAFSTLRSITGNGVAALILSPLVTVLTGWVVARKFFMDKPEISQKMEGGPE